MSIIMDIISVIGSGVSISGITLKDLIKKNPNKVEIERYIKFLEPKKVLTAPLDEEIIYAVIKSLEEIKKETENLKEIDTRVEAERKAIRPLHSGVKKILKQLEAFGHRDYKKLSSEEKEMLRTLLNSSEALSERIGVKLQ